MTEVLTLVFVVVWIIFGILGIMGSLLFIFALAANSKKPKSEDPKGDFPIFDFSEN